MKDDDWEMLSSLIQTELREATAEMEPDEVPEAVRAFLLSPHPPPGSRKKVSTDLNGSRAVVGEVFSGIAAMSEW